jgi:hypothetical protein
MAAAKAVGTSDNNDNDAMMRDVTMPMMPTTNLTPEKMTPTRTTTRKTAAVVAAPPISRFTIPPRCSASTMQLLSLSLSSSKMRTMTTRSLYPRCQRLLPPSSTSSSLSSISSTDVDRGEEDRRRDCLVEVGGHTTRIAGWAARRAALSDRHRALPPLRRGQWPLALEDKLVLCHGFVSANRPAQPPATTTTTMTALGPKSDKGQPAIDDRWMAGNDKESSRQEQTTTNHCALKAGEQLPAERAAGDE